MKNALGFGSNSVIFFSTTHKECSCCRQQKLHSEFYKDKNKYGLAYYCKECAISKSKTFYNYQKETVPFFREKRTFQGKKIRTEVKQRAVELLGNHCQDCKQQFPLSVYDFHHLNPKEKDFHIGNQRTWSERLQKELTKCVLLCANCHRIRHFEGG